MAHLRDDRTPIPWRSAMGYKLVPLRGYEKISHGVGTEHSPRQRRGTATNVPVRAILEARSGGGRNVDGARNRISPPRAPDKIAPPVESRSTLFFPPTTEVVPVRAISRASPRRVYDFRLRPRQPRGAGAPSKLRICGTIVLMSHGAAMGYKLVPLRGTKKFPTEWEQTPPAELDLA